MIAQLLRWCLNQRLLVSLAGLAVIAAGWNALQTVPVDAIPNVGENQVIVLTEWPGRSPKDIEDQITYPLSIALQAVPGTRGIRGKSMFGFSFVQVTFDDSVDVYWARSRVLEQLATSASRLPEGVEPTLGPDATALGQIYYYALEAPPGMDLAALRSKQDYFLKYALQSVEGVAEVASIGGYVNQYQVDVDPDRLRHYQLPLSRVIQAVREANLDVGAKTVESGGMEFLVRGRGFLGSTSTPDSILDEIRGTVVASREGVPIRVGDVAEVQEGPAFRRGALDFNGQEAVGGVVAMRYGENPRAVIERVKAKLVELEPELDGIRVHGVYDRTLLVDETIATLTDALIAETLITIVVVVLFLLHLRSSLIIAVTLPMAVLMAFIGMQWLGIDANIMSLAGIAIAIGTMVDMGIIILENIYDGLAAWQRDGRPGGAERRLDVIRESATEVVPAVVTAVTTTIVSFLPVFFLTGRDFRLFAPLAWTKSLALVSSLIVAVVFIPLFCRWFMQGAERTRSWAWGSAGLCGSLMMLLVWGVWGESARHWTGVPGWACGLGAAVMAAVIGFRLQRERMSSLEENPLSRLIHGLYAGRLRLALERKGLMLSVPVALFVMGLAAWFGLPKLMAPVESCASFFGADLRGLPGYEALKRRVSGLKSDDWIALDEGSWFYMPSLYPAASFSQAFEVLQTQDALIGSIPEVASVLGKIGRVDSALDPAPAAMVETYVMLKPKHQWRDGVTARQIWDEINAKATLPGVTPASPLQPIEGRVVMLQSGIKAAMAVRIYGDDLEGLSQAAHEVAGRLKTLECVNAGTVNPDIVLGKPYYEFEIDRDEAARYGMTNQRVQEIVSAGLGGLDVTSTVEGRERYPIQVRFARGSRAYAEDLPNITVVTPSGEVVPLERLAKVSTLWGPGSIQSENARLVAHVSFSPSGQLGDLETVAAVMQDLREARSADALQLPDGNFEFEAVGSFQNQIEANQRLMWIIPLVILINLVLHFLHFKNLPVSIIVFSGIPFAAAGGMIAVALSGIEVNTAMWVGFIGLFGLAADDGIVMATYIHDRFAEESPRSIREIRDLVYQAGLKRIRPCVMTTLTTLAALVPILVSDGRGADVARAMAWPVFGGMLVEPFTTFIVPTLYCGYLELKHHLSGSVRDELEQETHADVPAYRTAA